MPLRREDLPLLLRPRKATSGVRKAVSECGCLRHSVAVHDLRGRCILKKSSAAAACWEVAGAVSVNSDWMPRLGWTRSASWDARGVLWYWRRHGAHGDNVRGLAWCKDLTSGRELSSLDHLILSIDTSIGGQTSTVALSTSQCQQQLLSLIHIGLDSSPTVFVMLVMFAKFAMYTVYAIPLQRLPHIAVGTIVSCEVQQFNGNLIRHSRGCRLTYRLGAEKEHDQRSVGLQQ